MTLLLHIASDHALLTGVWDDALCVREETVTPGDPLRRHFSKPFIYVASPYSGHGGGFQFRDFHNEAGELVEEDNPRGRASRRGLAEFLALALEQQAAVEVFFRCSGDEYLRAKHRRRARPEDFTWDRTLFRDGALAVVSERGAEAGAGDDR
jgi:hypothetical protein